MKKSFLQMALSLTVVALAVVVTQTVRADDAAPPKPKQMTAYVVSTDVKAGELLVKKVAETTKISRAFQVPETTKFSTKDKKTITLGDLKSGDKVTVSFTQSGTNYIASAVELESKK